MARAHQIRADRLQCYSVTDNRVLPVLLNVWVEAVVTCRPTIPDSEQPRMDPYHRQYVKALYERLRECLKLVQESATKEANRQKRLYDRRVGAMDLRLGDCILVRLDAF